MPLMCSGCGGCEIPGVRWPAAMGDDSSVSWIERCDECGIYASDDLAAAVVEDETGLLVRHMSPLGSFSNQPYTTEIPHNGRFV